VNRYEIAIVVRDRLGSRETDNVFGIDEESTHADEWLLFAWIMEMIEEVRGELKPAS